MQHRLETLAQSGWELGSDEEEQYQDWLVVDHFSNGVEDLSNLEVIHERLVAKHGKDHITVLNDEYNGQGAVLLIHPEYPDISLDVTHMMDDIRQRGVLDQTNLQTILNEHVEQFWDGIDFADRLNLLLYEDGDPALALHDSVPEPIRGALEHRVAEESYQC